MTSLALVPMAWHPRVDRELAHRWPSHRRGLTLEHLEQTEGRWP